MAAAAQVEGGGEEGGRGLCAPRRSGELEGGYSRLPACTAWPCVAPALPCALDFHQEPMVRAGGAETFRGHAHRREGDSGP